MLFVCGGCNCTVGVFVECGMMCVFVCVGWVCVRCACVFVVCGFVVIVWQVSVFVCEGFVCVCGFRLCWCVWCVFAECF